MGTAATVVARDDLGLLLPPGAYHVTVTDGGLSPQSKEIDMVVEKDRTTEATVTFDASALKVTVLGNGEPRGAHIVVLLKDKEITEANTHGDNPVTFPVPPGTYDVIVTDGSVEPPALRRFEGIVVEEGKTTALTAEFAGGTLPVSALADGKPTQAWISVLDEKGDDIAGLRLGGDEPLQGRLTLAAGSYLVCVRPEAGEEEEREYPGITVETGSTTKLQAGSD